MHGVVSTSVPPPIITFGDGARPIDYLLRLHLQHYVVGLTWIDEDGVYGEQGETHEWDVELTEVSDPLIVRRWDETAERPTGEPYHIDVINVVRIHIY